MSAAAPADRRLFDLGRSDATTAELGGACGGPRAKSAGNQSGMAERKVGG